MLKRVYPSLLARIGGQVNLSLCSLDQNISVASRKLGDTGISGSAANSTLGDLAASPRVINAVTVTTDGVIAAVIPARFQGAISTTVANQSHIIKGLATGDPVLSTVFAAVEGFNASAIVYPVRSTDGTLIGLVSVPFQPESLLPDAINPLVDARVYEVTVIQADGRVLYATNTSQAGMSSHTDPLFASLPDLTRFINRVASEDSGRGNYSVHDPGNEYEYDSGKLLDDGLVAWHSVENCPRYSKRITGRNGMVFYEKDPGNFYFLKK